MKIFILYLNILLTIKYIYGKYFGINIECEHINKLLGKEPSNDCCKEEAVNCSNGHIYEL